MSFCAIDITNSVARVRPVSCICMKCILERAVVDNEIEIKMCTYEIFIDAIALC